MGTRIAPRTALAWALLTACGDTVPSTPMHTLAAGSAAPAVATTYTEHVRPILSRACVQCHSEGQIAPFSLDTYERAKPFAALIAKATRARVMPPSVIDNSGACNTFRDLPYLSDREIDTLERWSQQNAPEGDSSVVAPAKLELPKLTGDIRTVATPSYVPSTAKRDDWRCFVVDSPFEEETFVTGYDTRPGDKKTAHHMVIFYPFNDAVADAAIARDAAEEGPGYTCFGSPSVPASIIAAWAPGGGATLYPSGLGIPVVPKRPLIIQMHYNTADSRNPAADRTEIDLQVQAQGIHPGAFVQVLDLEMSLQPGRTDAEELVQQAIADRMVDKTGPVEIYGIFPHMHELGRTLKLTVDRAGTEQCVLDAPRYDFHWQRLYFLDKPVTVDAKDRLSARCRYDTTTRTQVTGWGESTQDEMCVAGLFVKL